MLKQKLEARAPAASPRASSETYLVSTATDHCNAKIRANALDIKILLERQGILERWAPVLNQGFPLDARIVTEQLLPLLALPSIAWPNKGYELNDFLSAMAHHDGRVRIVNVNKERFRFDLGECAAEFAHVAIGAIACDTAAVESASADVVLTTIRKLGIDSMPNLSYVRQIKQVLGISTSDESRS